jgi:dihydrofolate reductase
VPRPPIEMAGGTTFHFLSAAPREALDRALGAAEGKDVRVGGGATVVRDYLKAGLVDQLHVAIAPILLGRGIRLWDDLRGLESGYDVTTETAESGTIHLTFRR